MRNFIKKITHPFLKLGLNLYYLKPRPYRYENIRIKIHRDVFPPQLTFSTKILLDFVNGINLDRKSFLELGCGSGIISLLASKKGATVTASDINQTALDYLANNAARNKLPLITIYSDLFENLRHHTFDFIIINPPYYPRKPKNVKERAWFCGEHFEYFEALFSQLPHQLNPKTECYLILSQDCDLERIKSIAHKNTLAFELVLEKKEMAETNYVFKIISS